MISYEHALRTVLEETRCLGAVHCPLERSLGRIAAEDIRATVHLPGVDRSAVDGYALRSVDTLRAATEGPVRLRVVGEVYSSTERPPEVRTGETIAIMTGGAVPPGADTIVKQEEVESDGDTITLRVAIPPRRSISEKGKDMDKGALIAKRGTVIGPVAYSILASIRLPVVPVTERPAVSILAIGNELVGLSDKGDGHKIVASNLFMLSALMKTMGVPVALARITKDNREAILADLKEGLENDLLITTGGTGYGRSDLTRSAMEESGIRLRFSGMSVVPGKGTSFGLFKGKPVFALPGSPSAVFTVFHMLIRPCLRMLMGQEQNAPTTTTAVLEEDLHKRPGLEHFVTGQVSVREGGCRVRPVGSPDHTVFSAMSMANGFIAVPQDQDHLKRGSIVSVHLLGPSPSSTPLPDTIHPRNKGEWASTPCVSIVGKSDAGKTTLLEKLIPEMVRRGYRVGTVKHDVHGFDIDREGKDSWRHKQAGAATVVLSSPSKVAMIRDVPAEEPLGRLVEKYFLDRDIVLTEGFKRERMPKVEIFRKGVHQEPLCKDDEDLAALVSDTTTDLGVPCFALDDIKGLADFLVETFLSP
ncbi:MAG: molybdopterin-guanine dinucleotide biosynthesis protein B [Deltaproteobacteria bacterium]|nr:molybdopterin-guanine dinucleotide biosynthesis protein B [Deltaproteobacteria bacterium]